MNKRKKSESEEMDDLAVIYLEHGQLRKMAREHGWCERTVGEALRYPRGKSPLQMHIREVAMREYDGYKREH